MKSSILSDDNNLTFFHIAEFELISLVGGLLYRFGPNNQFDKKFLNLGCGTTYFSDWTNADFYHLPIKFWKKQVRRTPDWMLDIRRPLKCPNDYWDGVFTEHTLEHITHAEGFRLLKELYRVLKPNGILRIILPDIKKAVEFYVERSKNEYFVKNFDTGAEAIWEITQNYNHKSVWDAELMMLVLNKVGFRNVTEMKFGYSISDEIVKDKPDREPYSFYIEAVK